MEDVNVGKKILEYRKAKNLNIRELANLSKVTPSLLSQIERGLANPSLNTLKIIAKVLEVPIFTFFVSDTNKKNLVVRSDYRKKINFPENENLSYELLSPDLGGAIEFALMKLTPQSYSSEGLMEHKGEEVAFIIEGKIKLYLGEDVVVLNTGDSVRIPSYRKHKWENPYDKDANVIFAITPPSF